MSKEIRAERIKNVILENSTYEELAEKTGISVSTLVRIATAKTEPKFSDIIKIAMVTGVDLNELAHGDIVNIKENAMLKMMSKMTKLLRLIISSSGIYPV